MPNRRPRPVRLCVCGSHGFVRATRGHVTLVDPGDICLAEGANWHADETGRIAYARSCRTVYAAGSYLHRIIMAVPDGKFVDHINGNGMDNRRCNLRLASTQENQKNSRPRAGSSSTFKGVCWHAKQGRWTVGIKVGGKRKHLGMFDCERSAGLAYDAAARRYYGEFAYLNFPEAP